MKCEHTGSVIDCLIFILISIHFLTHVSKISKFCVPSSYPYIQNVQGSQKFGSGPGHDLPHALDFWASKHQ